VTKATETKGAETKAQESASTASTSGTKPGSSNPPATPADLSAALLELLRKLNAEVPTTRPLDGLAKRAVENFQEISADLATLADARNALSNSRTR